MTAGTIKWSQLLDIDNREWKIFNILPFKITKNCKLQWFQYRINNRILATNSFLFKIKKVNCKMCTFCHREEETIEHILWECDCVQAFLDEFQLYIEDKTNFHIVFTKKYFILGTPGKKFCMQNTLILWLKYYIYTARCTEKSLNIRFAISYLKLFYETQKFLFYKNGDSEKFDTQWNRWSLIFT